MKAKFEWYLQPTAEEIAEAWDKGILTVDANVPLDLYRYHSSTCQSLLDAMEAFGERVWISDQAATEFIKNRKSVIVSAEKTFRDAKSGLEELNKTVDGAVSKLRAFRLVPRASLDDLSVRLNEAVTAALGQVEEARASHPNYLKSDPIFDRLLKLFDQRVGAPPSDDQKKILLDEGERRRLARIPPGYMDEGKDGDNAYGDFLLWDQVLEFSKATGLPIILVTSERKEDWWEERSGKTVGPRIELIKEAFERTGQRIYIYKTDHFLERAAVTKGTTVDAESVEEIREISARRSTRRAEVVPAVRVHQIMIDSNPLNNLGLLEIELLRPVGNLTGSGHLEPRMVGVPRVAATILEAPADCPNFRISAGTGTDFDFNIHLRSLDKDQALPPGLYVIEYEANVGPGAAADENSAPRPEDD